MRRYIVDRSQSACLEAEEISPARGDGLREGQPGEIRYGILSFLAHRGLALWPDVERGKSPLHVSFAREAK